MKKRSLLTIFFIAIVFFLFIGSISAYAMGRFPRPDERPDPPPWRNPDPTDPSPPSAPEPLTIILIGMGASGAAGYYIGKRKKK